MVVQAASDVETARVLLSCCYTTLGRASSPDEHSNNSNNITDCSGIVVGIRGHLGMEHTPHPYGAKPGHDTRTPGQRSLLLNEMADQGRWEGWWPANLGQGNDDITKLGVCEPLL